MSYINFKKSICFLHSYRNGGTSIISWLDKNIGKNQFRSSSNIFLDKFYRYSIKIFKLNSPFSNKSILNYRIKYAMTGGHLRYQEIAPLIKEKCSSINIFGIMRDPISLIESLYGYHLKKGKFPYFKDKIPCIDEFIEARCSDPLIHDQASFILDKNGAFPENLNILRFENLQNEFSEYISRIYPENKFNTNLKHLNKRKSFNFFTNENSISLIKKRFKRDYDILETIPLSNNL